ncbi:MAG TPA: acyl-CoA dehydrogenase family protein, partial [Geothrix sp.]|nr:acyl-CoA dehydrogenase family protein [Geothrix sp.]
PEDRLLGGKGKGARIAFGILNIGRFKLGASSAGAGKRVLEYTLKYAGERTQFGKPLTAFGLIQQKLANMAIRIFVGESMNFRTIGYLDEALARTSWESETGGADKMKAIEEYAVEASMAKVWGSEALFATADDAVQTFGGAGFSAEYPAEKIYRDCRINRIFEGTNEINRLLIAGTFLKRCSGAEGLPLQEAATAPLDLPQDALLRTVALAKARALKVIALAQADRGPKILDNQEAAARIANLLLEIYAMESAVIRARRMAETGHRWAGLAQDMATVYAQEAWNRVQAEARMLAAELASDAVLDTLVADLLAMHAPVPVALSGLRHDISRILVEQGRYPLSPA